MITTWEQLASPTKAGIYEIEGLGTVLITQFDLYPPPTLIENMEIVLMAAKPPADYRIDRWQAKE